MPRLHAHLQPCLLGSKGESTLSVLRLQAFLAGRDHPHRQVLPILNPRHQIQDDINLFLDSVA